MIVTSKWRDYFNNPALAVFSRAIAAIFGGYLLAALVCGLLPLMLPLPRAESVLIAMMLSFTFYALAALWCFCVKRPRQAWRDILGTSACLYLLILLLG